VEAGCRTESATNARFRYLDAGGKRTRDAAVLERLQGPAVPPARKDVWITAQDFRTWGGTLLAAMYFTEAVERRGFPESVTEQKRSVSSVMRRVAKQLGNTPR
jgi:DNA topoisomerase-1